MADGKLIFESGIDKSGLSKDLKSIKTDMNSAGNEVSSAFAQTGGKFSKLGSIAKTAGKATAGAFVAGGTAMVAVGKQALNLYGEYEQVSGGIKKLFGDAYGTVMENAKEAYKTCGLSANEYMQQATSFSASLLQSVGGDTQKAAKYADTAMKDMSDNANTYGTSITDIQNAYQGFAKQNYTMLDNLKLGYGGTKTEMERLLSDAEKLTGTHYDIENFSDVVAAIHAVQGELNITGTTAKEASTTIQGSVNMTQKAWLDLLAGLADDNADVGELVQNFVTSLTTAIGNIAPRIVTILQNIAKAFPTLLKQVVDALIDIIVTTLPDLIIAVATALNEIIPAIVNGLTKMIEVLVKQLPVILPLIINGLLALVKALCESFSTLYPLFIQAIFMIVSVLLKEVPNIIKTLLPMIPKIIFALIKGMVIYYGTILKAAWNLVKTFAKGLMKADKLIKEWAIGVIRKIKTTIKDKALELASAGKNIVGGIWQGIKDKWKDLLAKLKEKVTGIPKAVKKWLGIKSPSRVMIPIGEFVTEGLEKGMVNRFSHLGKVQRQMADIVTQPIVYGANAQAEILSARTVQMPVQAGDNIVNQTVNINQPVATPAETARALKMQAKYGLAGA